MSRMMLCVFVIISIISVISCGSDPASPETGVMNVSGAWQGTWESSNYPTSGPFSAAITQNGANISGTIDIPDIGFDDVQITGTVSSNSLAFGDVNDEIQFTGTIASDTASASGDYTNPGLSDQGTWTMERVSGSYISLADSVATPFQFFSGTDMAWAASRFWVPGSSSIYSVTPGTGAIDSIVAPGDYLSGITFDGTALIVADGPMGTSKMFRLDLLAPSVLMAPEESATQGLAYDGSDLWCLDGYGLRIYRMSLDGTVLGSFSCLGNLAQGLAFDGTDLWYGSFNSGSGNAYIYHVDTSGNLISSFESPSFMPGGLTCDGQSLWASDDGSDEIYELDYSGTLLSSFGCPNYGEDLAWDGTYLWLSCSDPVFSAQIYCMDRSGNIVDSIQCPGDDPCGLTYDGSDLWNADDMTGRIYRLDPDGGNFIQLPPFNLDYLAFDGTLFWANDAGQSLICGFDGTGTVSASFPYPCDDIGGLEWMDGSLWVLGRDMSSLSSAYRLDTGGTVIAEYSAMGSMPEPLGTACDGSSLWYLGRTPLAVYCKAYRTELND